MIGENTDDSLTPTSKRRRRPASLGTGMQPPIGPPTPQRRLATHHIFPGHLDGQRVTEGHKMALLYIFCNLLPVRHPWRRYHGCGGGQVLPPRAPPRPPPGGESHHPPFGSPSASAVCGLRSAVSPLPSPVVTPSAVGWMVVGILMPTPRYLFLRRSATPSERHSVAQKTASISLCLETSDTPRSLTRFGQQCQTAGRTTTASTSAKKSR